ncbi:exonuclease subunit SbcD [Leptolyngbya sp. FACHB-261]|uniref:exonuclease subunit SbcD n=1 Tax=Leptolyngbya sp. FACHB-261 TaxID=2692806 RepID=UPI001682FA32|nr:exonuclease subunit SbcD [Leptolyngbya sp. FACHB-261]MBD2103832.1 exonuclease subunit SbcD [Leptolyngbya sp. FACHB-261]
MPIRILHLSDIHLGSGLAHGRLNPQTGQNTRFEDFTQALSLCIERALTEPVDLVLFGGDAFPDATPAPLIQEAFARQFRRLADAGIPTVLLVGNHDQHAQGIGGASLNIYRTLGVPGFIVGDRLTTHRIETRSGPLQVTTLPWLTRSTLLTRSETQGLSLAAINRLLLEKLQLALEGEVRQLDPQLPTVLLAHLMVETATWGAERFLAVGRGLTVPLGVLTRDCFDYVALGHVHKHQILAQQPPVVYPGSIERVDFGEEHEPKGFVRVDLVKGEATVQFCPLAVRPFRTLSVDVTNQANPQTSLEQAILGADIQGSVVRLVYRLRPEQLSQIDRSTLHQLLAVAHTATLIPEVVNLVERARWPNLSSAALDPLTALQAYLKGREELTQLEPDLMEAARNLLTETHTSIEEAVQEQLRLL